MKRNNKYGEILISLTFNTLHLYKKNMPVKLNLCKTIYRNRKT